MHRVFLLIVIGVCSGFLSPSAAHAESSSVGNFCCSDCALSQTPGIEDSIFISTVVNNYVSSWANKTVVICNSSSCATYQYTGGGRFLKIDEEDNDGQYEYTAEESAEGGQSGGGHGGGEGSNPNGGGSGTGGSSPNGGGGCTGDCGGGTVTVGEIGDGGGAGGGTCHGMNEDECAESVN
jgi:hypothetical protein